MVGRSQGRLGELCHPFRSASFAGGIMTSAAAIPPTSPKSRSATAAPASAVARFPDFPPRNDMMNPVHLHDYGNQPALRLHLGNPDTTIVLGEVPIAREVPLGRTGVRIPDLLVAFNVDTEHILAQMGYAINEIGKPPDLVLEVASNTTSRRDETVKRRDYAAFGVPEYWLFDPDWGRRYERGLIGWTLVDGEYEAIPIHQDAPDEHYGYSAVLGLYVCWEHRRLRWYDAAVGYLRSHDEERLDRITAEYALGQERTARLSTEQVLDQERAAHLSAEQALERERVAHISAEQALERERAARQELEDLLRRHGVPPPAGDDRNRG